MRIQHNIMAMNAYRNYNTNTSALSKNLEKLSSGYKINRAGDDAAGLAISEKMRAQITGLEAAQKNVKDGVSLVKTAEGAMQEIQDMLNRMDYLATQSANGTYDNEVDRANLQKEVDALKTEINRIADSANFNGIKLLDGSMAMNGDAFDVKATTQDVTTGGGNATIALTYSSSTASDTHLQDGVEEVPPEFVVDLSKASMAITSANGKITLSIGTFSCTTASLATTAGKATIVAAIVKAINGGSNASDIAFKLGTGSKTAWFKASASGSSSIKFTFAGVGATKGAALKATAVTSDVVSKFDDFIGQKVEVAGATKATVSGDTTCDITEIKRAVAADGGTRAGISAEITASMVQEGNTITIGGIGSTTGTTFKFKVSATSTLSGTDVIDVSNVKGSTAQIKEAIAQLTNKTVQNFKISAGTGNKLHVDYTGNSTAAYPTWEEAQKMITAKTGSTTTTKTYNAAEITVKDNDAIASGNTLTFGTGSNAVKIAFTTASDASAKNTDKVKYVTIASTASKTAKAIADSIGSLATASGNKVIYRSASVDDAAPALSSKNLTLQIGDTSDSYNQLGVAVGDMHTDAMGIAGIDIGNQEGAQAAIQTIRNAINYVSSVRGDLGATQNRLEHTANNLSVMAENIQDAESTIRDTDVAEEMMSYVKNNILVQSAQAMLAQANQVPQGVLQLLG